MAAKSRPEFQQEFNGQTFWKCGHYYQRYGKRLHRVVWEHSFGTVPEGFDIHHKDGNKSNNAISNLECIIKSKHRSDHSKELVAKGVIGTAAHIQRIQEAAKIWHGSDTGRDWHREHYEEFKHLLHARVERQCSFCGKLHNTCKQSSENTFCSNNCKSAWRRKSGFDTVQRICEICGNEFNCNKYNKTTTCSRACSCERSKRTRGSKCSTM